MIRSQARRTAISGIGVVAPGGTSREAFWQRITSGESAARRITFFDPSGFRSQIAAECDFDPYAAGLNDQEVRRLDRHVQFALAAAREAMGDSELDPNQADRERMGVSLGTACGGALSFEEDYVACSNRGMEWLVDPAYVSPFLYEASLPSSLASELALAFSAHGPATVNISGYTAGIDAVGHGHELIANDEADIVIAGGAESPITPTCLAGLDAIKVTSQRNDDPEHASRPFDRDRDGFVLGEGGAVLVLEDLEGAIRRGVHAYAEIAGFASRSTAYHMTGLPADGAELSEAISEAMQQGSVQPEDIDYICAYGSGTRQSDRHETAAYKQALGAAAYSTPISSIKSTIGHALGASGALQLAAGALAIEHGIIPPTANWEHPDAHCDLDWTPNVRREGPIDAALIVASSPGGLQSAMVLVRPREWSEAGS